MKKKALSLALALISVVFLLPTVVLASGQYGEIIDADGTIHTLQTSLGGKDEGLSGDGWSWDSSAEVLTLNGFHGRAIKFYGCGTKLVLADGGANSLSECLYIAPGDWGMLIEGTGELVIDRTINKPKDDYDRPFYINYKSDTVTIASPLKLTGGMNAGNDAPLTLVRETNNYGYLTGYVATANGDKAHYIRIAQSVQPQQPVQPTGTQAQPTNDSLARDGELQDPTVYKIDGSNYFKIRDLAAILNGTEKQFSVGYDSEKQSVTAATGQGYEMTGTELAGAPAGAETAQVSNDAIYVDGQKVEAQVYKIGGSNYFKLRDLGKALNFYVGWSQEQGMFIETDKPYSE